MNTPKLPEYRIISPNISVYSIIFALIFSVFLNISSGFAQLPSKVLVGYHENWKTLRLSQIHANYNVVCLAFALPVNYPSVGYDLRYTLPPGYTSTTQMMADIDLLHSQGKVVLLSIGGATGPIKLNNSTEQSVFINSINNIFATYGHKIDGLDIDLEGQSMSFGSTWTMTSPAIGQTLMVNAIKSVMQTYQTRHGKKMILTMAPEVVYLMGGLSTWQVDNANGGAFLPILDGLRNELDLLHMQLYNAGGSSGGVYAWNNVIYYDNGSPDFALAMNESIIRGFTCVRSKGTFVGIPDTKVAFGLPATSAASTAGTGYLTPTNVCNAARYFKGEIAKPAGVNYTMSAARPGLKGLMTWSINEDQTSVNGAWNFAINYPCAFPNTTTAPTANFTHTPTTGCTGQTVTFTDASTNSPTSWSWNFGSGAVPATATTQGPHNVTYSTAGTKTVTLTVSNAGGSNISTKSVTINATPAQPSTITGNTTVCAGTSGTYSVTNVTGVTYNWTYSGTGVTFSGTTASVTATFASNATSGTITVTPVSNGCTGTPRTQAITVNPVPAQPSTITGNTTVCAGTSGTYSVTNVTGVTYNWTYSGTGVTFSGNTASVTAIFASNATSGTITVTPSNACGNGTARTQAITVNPVPAQPSTITGNATVCAGTSGTYSVTNVTGVTYNWTYSGTGVTFSGNTASVTATFAANATSGTITVTPSNACGNGTARTQAITVNPVPAQPSTITGNATVCAGTSGTYSVTNVTGVTYNWTYSGTGVTFSGNTASVTATYASNATSGTITVTPSNACGNGTARTQAITVNPVPAQPSTITGNATVCVGTSGTYSVTNVTGVTYNWTYSGTGVTFSGNTASVTATFAANATSGTITVTPSNACGNGTARTQAITVNPVPAQPSTIAGNATVCAGTSGTYSVTNVTGVTYNWTYSGTGVTFS
ncbi:MAG: PKD domain-containing protein, partial [Cytophagaceae bacterium]